MPSWNWAESASESGAVHESVANTDHDNSAILKQGYQIANPYLSSSLVGYWPLQEDSGSTAYDFSGNNNDGTYNGPTLGQTGLLGTTAPSFDGTDDTVTVPDDAVISALDPITVGFWFNPSTDLSGGSANNWNFIRKDTEWVVDNDGSLGDGSAIAMGIYGDRLTTSKSSWFSGTWYQIYFVLDSANGRFEVFVDGTSDNSKTPGDNTNTDSSNDVYIGERQDGTYSYPGRIADIRLHDTALSASEIQTLYDVVATQGAWESTTKTL